MKNKKNKNEKNYLSGLGLMIQRRTRLYTGVVFTLPFVIASVAVSGYMLTAQAKESDMKLSDNSSDVSMVSDSSVVGKKDTDTDVKKTNIQSNAEKTTNQTGLAEPALAPTVTTATTPGTMNGMRLYNDGVLESLGRPSEIASQPTARWFGDWNTDVRQQAAQVVDASTADNSMAVIVVYNIPQRDCGSYSAGGAEDSAAYRAWIDKLAAGVRKRQAIVILEPDALASMDCLSETEQDNRLSDLAYAVDTFATQTLAHIYIDAGNASWQSTSTMVDLLGRANVAQATGFALNVSNFVQTDVSNIYGEEIASQLGGKSYVIDTSRNGNGPAPDDEWCNPGGRALGESPTTNTEVEYADAYLWIKVPGESDGECNGGPAAGEWWQSYADELILNSN